ncbi:MAG: hypothetical protein K8S56_00835 [Candidatus Cloacimonetes bacterium]|nr:hypothetical protein [Candidatus Cloacimonadota bacterium]
MMPVQLARFCQYLKSCYSQRRVTNLGHNETFVGYARDDRPKREVY